MLRFISICLFIELWEAISQTYKKNLDGIENSYQSNYLEKIIEYLLIMMAVIK